MIGYYKVSAIGTDHLDKPGGVCQDSSDVKQLDNGFTIAVAADGLGSASRSDVGSKVAVRAVIGYVAKNIVPGQSDAQYVSLLEKAYRYAYNSVLQAADDIGVPAKELNTTLMAAVYDGRNVYFGQCGDGGIIVLTYGGDYVCITDVKKGEAFNETFPLLGGSGNWSFGRYSGDVCALTMMTDGIFDIVCHPLLANERQKINIPFIRRFMDRNILRANNAADMEMLQTGIERFVRGSGLPGVTDDKTIVGLINTEIMPQLKDDEYYSEPDWDKLKENMKKKLREKPSAAGLAETSSRDTAPQHDANDLREIADLRQRCAELDNRCEELYDRVSLLKKIVIGLVAVVLLLTASVCIMISRNRAASKQSEKNDSSVTVTKKSKKSTKSTDTEKEKSSDEAETTKKKKSKQTEKQTEQTEKQPVVAGEEPDMNAEPPEEEEVEEEEEEQQEVPEQQEGEEDDG